MTTLGLPVPVAAGRHRTTLARVAAHPGTRLGLLVVLTLGAFHYTLGTLVRSLGVESPLAYLGLVPFLALMVGIARARPLLAEPEIHDRHLDWIVGLPLVMAAVAANFFLPARMSTLFWVWRVDLLTLPVFVAGAVILLFGARLLIRVRWALAMLFLAWPIPFRTVLASGLGAFTTLTVRVLSTIVQPLGLASQVSGGDVGQFRVPAPGRAFDVLVVSACSGANSLLGFLLVAPCLLVFVRGSRRRRLAWVATGAALVWLGNVVRLVGIIAAGHVWGERLAFDVLHPYAGLVIFGAAMLGAVLLLPRFGLEWEWPTTGRRPVAATLERGAVLWRAAGALVSVVALVLLSLNAGLSKVDPIASAFGQARLAPFSLVSLHIDGFKGRAVDRFDWARRYFGNDSDWTRYEFAGLGTSTLSSDVPVTADVVTSSDLQTFDDFDIQACYSFHGYDVTTNQEFDLGAGVVGRILTWRNKRLVTAWTTLYWYWPVNVMGKVRYQRIALLLPHDAAARLQAPITPSHRPQATPGLAVDQFLRGTTKSDDDRSTEHERDFLLAFGRQLVRAATARSTRRA